MYETPHCIVQHCLILNIHTRGALFILIHTKMIIVTINEMVSYNANTIKAYANSIYEATCDVNGFFSSYYIVQY